MTPPRPMFPLLKRLAAYRISRAADGCGWVQLGTAAVVARLPFAWTRAANAAKVRDPIACRHIRALAAMPPSDDGRSQIGVFPGHPAGGSRGEWSQIRWWRSGGTAES